MITVDKDAIAGGNIPDLHGAIISCRNNQLAIR
jgi:hypothetical protein